MKPFSLEEYLANPSLKVVTRDGRKARIICTDRKGLNHPIVALVRNIEHIEYPAVYCIDGSLNEGHHLDSDLFFAPVKKKGKVFICKDDKGNPYCDQVILGEDSRFSISKESFPNLIALADIEWEE